ncbi:CAAX prenyl protease-related protein [Candidatus Magnetomoraceae bacterium gMMP-1]
MIPYVLPFVLYLVLTQIPSKFINYYAWLYPAVVIMTGSVTIYLLKGRRIIRPHRDIFAGVIFGLAGIALWIGLSHLALEKYILEYLPEWLQPGPRMAFNPFQSIQNPFACWSFIIIRFIGLAALVPIAEELFWRGFLMRWIISPEWEKQKLGQYTFQSFIWVTLLFTLAHPEWLAAAIYCTILNILIYWKHDLWNCIIAHGVSNLTLGIYVLSTANWDLW